MSTAIGKFNKICSIVTLRQMFVRKNAYHRITSDVPSGHVPICVGTSRRRFIVPMTYLNHPIIRKLLDEAEEEYGFANHGLLTIPCDESVFEAILRFVSRTVESRHINLEDFQRSCNMDYRRNIGESWPLLYRGLLSSTCK